MVTGLIIRYVRDIMGVVPQDARKVRAFIETIEAQYTARMAEIDRATAIMKTARPPKSSAAKPS